jgi:hypothetical protein
MPAKKTTTRKPATPKYTALRSIHIRDPKCPHFGTIATPGDGKQFTLRHLPADEIEMLVSMRFVAKL